jgi:hypothetical protein
MLQTNETTQTHELSELVSEIVQQSNERGSPFVIKWRSQPNETRWRDDGDAGCGCSVV